MIERNDHGPVRHLRINRPPANALSPELISALGEEVIRAPEDGARALVISGLPGMFSAGLDVPYLLRLDHHRIRATWDGFYRLLHALAGSPIPVVVAITGHAPAGGTVIALFCDYRVMAAGDAKLGLNEVRVGIPLPSTIYKALERLVGARRAERLLVSGELVAPEAALAMGLVDELVPAAEVEP
ncbi:MAG: enoyl-CoA hydratase/isomerase family protein, partial [Thermoanaerobaculia bacterium]|nr:enoyl-CoA hydratase/isomerase family protein [Thermoanaerobaculia bacterium]